MDELGCDEVYFDIPSINSLYELPMETLMEAFGMREAPPCTVFGFLGAGHFPCWVLIRRARRRGQGCCGGGGFRSGLTCGLVTTAGHRSAVCYHVLRLTSHGAFVSHTRTTRARNRNHSRWRLRSLFVFVGPPCPFPLVSTCGGLPVWGRGYGVAHLWVVRPGAASQKERLPLRTSCVYGSVTTATHHSAVCMHVIALTMFSLALPCRHMCLICRCFIIRELARSHVFFAALASSRSRKEVCLQTFMIVRLSGDVAVALVFAWISTFALDKFTIACVLQLLSAEFSTFFSTSRSNWNACLFFKSMCRNTQGSPEQRSEIRFCETRRNLPCHHIGTFLELCSLVSSLITLSCPDTFLSAIQRSIRHLPQLHLEGPCRCALHARA